MIVQPEVRDSPLTQASKNAREGRIFALTVAGGFLLLALVASWRGTHRVSVIALSISALSLLAALFLPGRLGGIRKVWMKIGEAIGLVTTPIMMGLVYYIVMTPIAVVRRATAKRRIARDSNWRQRPPLPPPSRMERQF